jgi:DNA adenine methylase
MTSAIQTTLLTNLPNSFSVTAKPVLKWAGGKSQLLEQIAAALPQDLKAGKIRRYVEPFIGGGAVFFYIAQNFSVDEFYISDVNEELILLYSTIQQDVDALTRLLSKIETQYLALNSEERREYFLKTRAKYNRQLSKVDSSVFSPDWVERAAQIIFLNRTCFNGLFRVNSKGEFNVPFGNYKNPRICDEANLRAVSQVFKTTEIRQADFTACEDLVSRDTFVYFDPPYRPISKTASFKSYSRFDFDDDEQTRLAEFYRQLDSKGAKLMLSNSDPQNQTPDDDFFEQLYKGLKINRVNATRMINSDASKRGAITELLITNY